jgi:hypothetical protein
MKTIINCETGEIVERELTKAEKDQQKIDQTFYDLNKSEAEAKAVQRQAILNRLGLTSEETALLLS